MQENVQWDGEYHAKVTQANGPDNQLPSTEIQGTLLVR